MASPTERADRVRRFVPFGQQVHELPEGSQLVTPEDIQAGYRVLTPEQVEAVALAIQRRGLLFKDEHEALALLAGVPGKDSDT